MNGVGAGMENEISVLLKLLISFELGSYANSINQRSLITDFSRTFFPLFFPLCQLENRNSVLM